MATDLSLLTLGNPDSAKWGGQTIISADVGP